jgi:DNA-binding NtrC family response regulator
MPRVLVVDDEIGVQESLRMLLKADYEVATCGDVQSALAQIASDPPDLILLDLIMPGRSGLDLLEELSERGNTVPVIVLTATRTVSTAVEAMKRGAADYITKPFELDALRMKVRQLLQHRELEQEVERLRAEVQDRQQLGGLIGRSPAMQRVFRTIERVAKPRVTVLICGESGTGKELVARALHDLSPRSAGRFIGINCGAIPHHLTESELFGHERGAFTDAVERRIGRFEAASGGTLLLDEIGELDAAVQVKLLRALQERRIERLGSTESIPVDVRVIASTNRDLEADVRAGRFRADLFYRVNVVLVRLPPLRERREDIRLLADAFLERISSESQDERAAVRFSPGAYAALERYVWPGNVRELENAIEHAVAFCEDEWIKADDLPEAIRRSQETEALREDWRSRRFSFEETLARFEGQILRETLERHGWNQTHAAADLGITRRVLKLRMDRLDIEPPTRRSPTNMGLSPNHSV